MGESTTHAGSPRAGALRDAGWMTGERVRAYAGAALIAGIAWAIVSIVQGNWLIRADGGLVEGDFIAPWSAGRMALEGRAAAAYDWHLHHAAQVAAIGREFEGFFAWHNPPTVYFLAVPFAPLPYIPAWLLFGATTAAFFVATFRRVLPVRGAALIALGAPASILCFIAGQLGFLIAGLTALALTQMDRRPWVAGISLGLMTVKPQFGLIFPVLLAATGRWRVFAAASVATLGLMAASGIVFGWETWRAFLGSFNDETVALLRRGGSDWTKLQSIYACVQRVTGIESLAMAVHGAAALGILGVVAWLWRRPASPGVCAAAAVAGAFLITPYAYIYDAVVVVLAAAFLAREAIARGWLPWERVLLALAVLMPALYFVVGSYATPAAMGLILALAVRRARAEGATSAG